MKKYLALIPLCLLIFALGAGNSPDDRLNGIWNAEEPGNPSFITAIQVKDGLGLLSMAFPMHPTISANFDLKILKATGNEVYFEMFGGWSPDNKKTFTGVFVLESDGSLKMSLDGADSTVTLTKRKRFP